MNNTLKILTVTITTLLYLIIEYIYLQTENELKHASQPSSP